MGSLYNRVKVNNPGHSFFNLSYDKKFDCDAGQLIPLCSKFLMPNDVIKFGNEIVARMQPLVSPAMHEVNIYTQYFFVPLRIMFGYMKVHQYPGPSGSESVSEWEVNDHDFETFLTGGKTGYDTSVSLPYIYNGILGDYAVENDNFVHPLVYTEDSDGNPDPDNTVIKIPAGTALHRGYPYYTGINSEGAPYGVYNVSVEGDTSQTDLYCPLYMNEIPQNTGMYSLWDYLEFPIGINPDDINISAFPFMAYNLIWNNFFRDQNLMPEITVGGNSMSLKVKNVCWNKDYFTAAYTELQRGQSPALPLSNSLLPVFVDLPFDGVNTSGVSGALYGYSTSSSSDNTAAVGTLRADGSTYSRYDGPTVNPVGSNPFVVDASGLFNVNDLRLAMRVQEWLEVNLRVGTHLNEFLIGHFGIGPHDETLQRPVYLGGSKSPVIVSEVLQTSSSDDTSPQGNMAGHGISADRNYIGSYRAKEFGVFMGVMYIRPKATYQQGIDRSWLYQTKYDFPFPEFCHLGYQEIKECELFTKNTGNVDSDGNPVIFGYTERYNEFRSSQSKVCGGLRSTFDYWHLGRIFDDAPNYNADFVRCVPSKRIFAVETEPGFIVNVGNILHAYRPIPTFGDPRT